ncbi:tRNA pseudouridine synthase 1 [Quaeritorhiza haematococci]|nr:tRNA pseudouridine synthase 1 [Quaeritorhiza haematococci]
MQKIVVLFGYNGSKYAGLERTKGTRTVESELLTAMASLGAQNDPTRRVAFVNISRASTTEAGEHAARQALSLEIKDADHILRNADTINKLLPSDGSIRVYAITKAQDDFSARRTCDARTYEYVLPTFVFAPPSQRTFYYNPPQVDPNPEDLYPPPPPEGDGTNLVGTLKRVATLGRRSKSRPRRVNTDVNGNGNANGVATEGAAVSPPAAANGNGAAVAPPQPQETLPSPPTSPTGDEKDGKKTGTLKRFFETLTRGRKREKDDGQTRKGRSQHREERRPEEMNGSAAAPAAANDMSRPPAGSVYPNQENGDAGHQLPTPGYGTLSPAERAALPPSDYPEDEEDEYPKDRGLVATLRRSMSRKSLGRGASSGTRSRSVPPPNRGLDAASAGGSAATLSTSLPAGSVPHPNGVGEDGMIPGASLNYIDDGTNSGNPPAPQFFDPLDLPLPSEESLSELRQYRLTPHQFETLQHIIELYRGTHNFHNYIPGAAYDDPRCYMRIINIECTAPEVHFGMEWVRIRITARAFARFQIRRMIGLAIQVIRTNTPRSIVGNSFGFAKIEIPEVPAKGLVLEEAHYGAFNADPNTSKGVHFGDYDSSIASFKTTHIYDSIYKHELDTMSFEEWTRSLDRVSFLYTYYLNSAGIIGTKTAYIRPPEMGGVPPMPSLPPRGPGPQPVVGGMVGA